MMKKRPRKRILSADAKYVGDEPFYPTPPSPVEMTLAFNWYNYQFSNDKAVEFLNDYLKQHKMEPIRRLKDWEVPTTVGWIARMLSTESAVRSESVAWFEQKLVALYALQKGRVEQRAATVVVDRTPVAVRVKRQVATLIGEQLDTILDQFYNGEIEQFDLYQWMKENDIKGKQAGMVLQYLNTLLAELTSDEPEYVEARAGRTKRSIAREVKFYQGLIADGLKWQRGQKPVIRKARTRKEKTVRAKVSKVTIQLRDDDLKISSEDPSKIIGAEQVFVYNTKRRLLTAYYSTDPNGLQVSRSSIRGYDEALSTTKRVRKPEQTLHALIGQTKRQAKNTFDKMKVKGTEASGRLNANTIIVKVYK